MRFKAPEQWTDDFLSHGLFADLEYLFELSEFKQWPTLDYLNSLLRNVRNSQGQAIEFVAPSPEAELYYEAQVFELGKVPTRLENWHDLFGAFSWILFPKTKALLNQWHIEDLQQGEATTRSPRRNALTLLDECGVVVLYQQPEAIEALREHHWQQSFVAHRDQWFKTLKPYIFGHALYEMATRPYDGLTAKMLALPISEGFFSLPLLSQYRLLDEKLSDALLQNVLHDERQLSPLPLLGIPTWYAANEQPSYYENTEYFRPKPQK